MLIMKTMTNGEVKYVLQPFSLLILCYSMKNICERYGFYYHWDIIHAFGTFTQNVFAFCLFHFLHNIYYDTSYKDVGSIHITRL